MNTFENRITSETDIQKLYSIQIEISQEIKENHLKLMESNTNKEESIAKGDLGVYYILLDMVKDKIYSIKEENKKEANEQNRMNYNFRMASKNLLEEELYNTLINLARKTRKQARIEIRNDY